MNQNKRPINGSVCIGFALLFILIGATQFVLGYNRNMSVQIGIGVATWVYAVVLLIIGFIAEDKKKRSRAQDMFITDEEGEYVETQFTNDFDPMPEEQISIELAEQRIARYAQLEQIAPADAEEYAATMAGVRHLCAEARANMQSAEQEHSAAVDRAAEAYLNLDDKATLLRKVIAKTESGSANDEALRQRAARARDKAKHMAASADKAVENAKRQLERAKKYVSRTSKLRRAGEKLAPKFK